MQISRRATLKFLVAGGAVAAYGGGRAMALSSNAQELKIPALDSGVMKDGVRHFDLNLSLGSSEFFAGVKTPSYGVNGDYLGPTLKLRNGENVQLNVHNAIGQTSTLHWHGLHLPAAADGGPHQQVNNGASWQAKFEIKQHAATFWYHSHMLHKTGFQVYHGLAGFIIVEDEATGNRGLPQDYGVDDIPVVLQDRRFSGDGSFEYLSSMHDSMRGMHGDNLLVNGAPNAQFVARTDTLRLRLLNGSNARIYQLKFNDNRRFQMIATDGGLLQSPVATDEITLAPAERTEILVDVSDGKPVSLVSSTPAEGGMMGRMMSGMMGDSAKFNVLDIVPDEGRRRAIQVPEKLLTLATPDPSSAVRTRQFKLNMAMGMGMMRGNRGGAMTINGKSMDINRIDEVVKLGTQEIWVIDNPTNLAHPFHIHDVQFRILDRNGAPPSALEAGLKDTVLVHPDERVRVLLEFADYADPDHPYMYHCHILEHEDAGMMGQFSVVS